MLSKEYLYTARTLRRIALNMTDEKIADRLESLAKQYERRAQKGLCFGFGQCLSPARCSRRTPGVRHVRLNGRAGPITPICRRSCWIARCVFTLVGDESPLLTLTWR
jgi:hypothetical protein